MVTIGNECCWLVDAKMGAELRNVGVFDFKKTKGIRKKREAERNHKAMDQIHGADHQMRTEIIGNPVDVPFF